MGTTGGDPNHEIWDYLSKKNSIQTLEGHKLNVPFAEHQPILRITVIGSEGGTVKNAKRKTDLEISLTFQGM